MKITNRLMLEPAPEPSSKPCDCTSPAFCMKNQGTLQDGFACMLERSKLAAPALLSDLTRAQEQIAALQGRIEELDDALLYVTDEEEEPAIAYNNCIEGGRDRRKKNVEMDNSIEQQRAILTAPIAPEKEG